MNCPHCDEDMDVPITDVGPRGEPVVMYCSYCRLEGPVAVLEGLVSTFTADEVRVMHELLRDVQATGEFHAVKGDGGVQRSHIIGALCKFARLREKETP